MKIAGYFLMFFITLLMASCAKGYEVRVSNYNTEALDSVIVGNNTVVFKDVAKQATTDYNKLKAGSYTVIFVTKTKKQYSSSITIPKKGSGKRTIQVDGVNAISILEE